MISLKKMHLPILSTLILLASFKLVAAPPLLQEIINQHTVKSHSLNKSKLTDNLNYLTNILIGVPESHRLFFNRDRKYNQSLEEVIELTIPEIDKYQTTLKPTLLPDINQDVTNNSINSLIEQITSEWKQSRTFKNQTKDRYAVNVYIAKIYSDPDLGLSLVIAFVADENHLFWLSKTSSGIVEPERETWENIRDTLTAYIESTGNSIFGENWLRDSNQGAGIKDGYQYDVARVEYTLKPHEASLALAQESQKEDLYTQGAAAAYPYTPHPMTQAPTGFPSDKEEQTRNDAALARSLQTEDDAEAARDFDKQNYLMSAGPTHAESQQALKATEDLLTEAQTLYSAGAYNNLDDAIDALTLDNTGEASGNVVNELTNETLKLLEGTQLSDEEFNARLKDLLN